MLEDEIACQLCIGLLHQYMLQCMVKEIVVGSDALMLLFMVFVHGC